MDRLHLDHSFTNTLLKTVGLGTRSSILFKGALLGEHTALKPFSDQKENSVENLYPEGKVASVPRVFPKLLHGWVDVRDLAEPPKAQENFRHWYAQHKRKQKRGGKDGARAQR